ncbi:hypothetical protein ABT095_15000 [Kitasatospora sp. NPDC002227]|uniref:hypothetical protein n=1 Tax=Kitasatospora sp. NPDC002227 TaxID=3154773 RepID=UPI00332F388B
MASATNPPVEFAALAAVLPQLLAVTARPADEGPDELAPRVDIVVDRDDNENTTVARVYLDGVKISAGTAVHSDTDSLLPAVRFHLTDSGHFDDVQPHDWFEAVRAGVLGAPAAVQDFVMARAKEYHRPAQCLACLTPPRSTPSVPGLLLPATRDLDNFSLPQLEETHRAAADLIRARLTTLVRSELRAAVEDFRVEGKLPARAVVSGYGPFAGAEGLYDLDAVVLVSESGWTRKVDLSWSTGLVRAVESLAEWRPPAEDYALEIEL